MFAEIQVSSGAVASQSALRLSALLAGAFLVPVVLYVLMQKVVTTTTMKLTWYFVVWNGIALLIGLVSGNDLVYTIGDFYNTVQVFIVCLAVVLLSREHPVLIRHLWLGYIVIALLGELRYATGYVEYLVHGDYRRLMGGNYLLGMAAFSCLLESGRKHGPRALLWFALTVSGFVVLVAGYRGKWILMALGLIALTLAARPRLGQLARIASVGVIMLGVVTLTIAPLLTHVLHVIQSRVIKDTVEEYDAWGVDSSSKQKFYEITRVLEEFAERPAFILTGFGNGAEFELDARANVYMLDRYHHRSLLHNVHNSYFAILYRYGAIGLSLFLALWIGLVSMGRRALRRYFEADRMLCIGNEDKLLVPYGRLAWTYMLLALIGFTQDYYVGVYMGNAEWGIILGSLVVFTTRAQRLDLKRKEDDQSPTDLKATAARSC